MVREILKKTLRVRKKKKRKLKMMEMRK